ncbi:Hypothetical predicted protein [Paramuricea clavata]|uniref:Uncharacterized protein n=1 Tax=Paramuricea clavata TaxID=317549 RepID=A0A6S7J228_PARCT|nr:Hypothetical predicted protein [Paramuricea clavata]
MKHFKLGDYSFQIKAFEAENNTLQSEYRFKKPITITLVYDVEQMLKINKKVVSNEVTNEDVDPVLLLWDVKNQTWFQAAKTCPEPWTYVDKKAKVFKVKVCHLTQFALFWTFKAENGIFEFDKGVNDTLPRPPPNALIEEDNNVLYNRERYGGEMVLNIARYKGSTDPIILTWAVTIEPNAPPSFTVSPMFGELEFSEGQWNSSIHLWFPVVPETNQEIRIFVKLLNVSGGAMLGKFTRVKITFTPTVGQSEVKTPLENNSSNKTDLLLKILLPCLSSISLIIGIMATIYLCRGWKRYHAVNQAETSFIDKDPP